MQLIWHTEEEEMKTKGASREDIKQLNANFQRQVTKEKYKHVKEEMWQHSEKKKIYFS